MKHLIMGSEMESRSILESLIFEQGQKTVTTNDVRQAYAFIRDDDQIISLYIDWTIPDDDGLVLCRQVRDMNRQPYFPIIIVISPDCGTVIPQALQAGADNYLLKPLDKTFLSAQIQIIERVKILEDKLLTTNVRLEHRVKERTKELSIAYEKLQKTNQDLVVAYGNLSDTNREIADIDRLKTAFIDVTAHELRTPLTTSMGVLQLLRRKWIDASGEDAELLEIGVRAARRLAGKVDMAIQFAYQSQYERALEKASVNVQDLISDVMQDVMAFAKRRGQRIETVLSPDLPQICVDRDKIFDVMVNLLMNAIKFTPDKGRIILTVRRDDGEAIEFKVEDTGIGISEEDKPYIFKSFFTSLQTDGHSSGVYGLGARGLGLGLAVARKFVELHGGEIGLKSTSPKGSCFYFTIPI